MEDVSQEAPVSLVHIVLAGDHAQLAKTLDAGIDPHIPDDEGRFALNVAIQNGDKESVQLLLNAGAISSFANSTYRAWLLVRCTSFCSYGLVSIFSLACLNRTAYFLWPSPLISYTILYRATGVVLLILILLAITTMIYWYIISDLDERLSASLSTFGGDNEEIMLMMLKAGYHPTKNLVKVTLTAAEKGYTPVLRALAQQYVPLGCWSFALHSACSNHQLEACRVLLQLGADPTFLNPNGQSPLMLLLSKPTSKNKESVVEAMLELLLETSAKKSINTICESRSSSKDPWTPLSWAVHWRRINCIRILHGQGADPNLKGRFGRTALHYAATDFIKDDMPVLEVLLSIGAHLNELDDDGWTAIGLVANKGVCAAGTKLLLEKGADPSIGGGRFLYPLHVAARYSHGEELEMIRLLLDAGADIKAEGGKFGTALNAAVYRPPALVLEMLSLLVYHGADVNQRSPSSFSPLQTAVWESSYEGVNFLLREGADLSNFHTFAVLADSSHKHYHRPPSRFTMLSYAHPGQTKIIQALLEAGVSPDCDEAREGRMTLLEAACANRWQSGAASALVLLSSGADPNLAGPKGSFPLERALAAGSFDTAMMLLENGSSFDRRCAVYESALHAFSYGISKLSEYSLTPDKQDRILLVLQLLLVGSGSPVKVDKLTQTPLHVLALTGGEQEHYLHFGENGPEMKAGKASFASSLATPMLQKFGNDLAVRTDLLGRTAIHIAAGKGDVVMIENILSYASNYDLNKQDRDGRTPLHHAAAGGMQYACAFLLRAGAKVDVHCKKGNTPLDEAMEGSFVLLQPLLSGQASPILDEEA